MTQDLDSLKLATERTPESSDVLQQYTTWITWILWTIVTAIGYGTGVLLVGALWSFATIIIVYHCGHGVCRGMNTPAAIVINAIYGAIFGFIVGLGQWLIFRHYVPQGIRWLRDSLIGSSVAFSVLLLPVQLSFEKYAQELISPIAMVPIAMVVWVPCGIVIGGIVGWAQSRVLRIHTSHSGVWVAITTLCGLLLAFSAIAYFTISSEWYVRLLPSMLLPAFISGTAIFWLLRKPRTLKPA